MKPEPEVEQDADIASPEDTTVVDNKADIELPAEDFLWDQTVS